MNPAKHKFPRAFALEVAQQLERMFGPLADRFMICGSLRRHKPFVSDIEVVYIPKIVEMQIEGVLIPESENKNLFDTQLEHLLSKGDLVKRKNIKGHETWGADNKLAKLTRSLIPVDFFATNETAWWSQVCCRTGGAINNTNISRAAIDRHWRWHPYRGCFSKPDGSETHPITCEEDNFTFVSMPYLEPWKRP